MQGELIGVLSVASFYYKGSVELVLTSSMP